MAAIFLSYRRNDAPGFAGRLAEDLEAALGAGSVFRDVDDIRPGQDFVGVIERELGSVGVALVMIGPGWLEARAEGQRRRMIPGTTCAWRLSPPLRPARRSSRCW